MQDSTDNSADRTHALLNINGSFTAPEVENLIRKLAMRRAQMEPPPPLQGDMASSVEDVLTFGIEPPDTAGACIMRIRSSGFGWLGLRFSADYLAAIHEFLGRFQNHSPARVDPKRH